MEYTFGLLHISKTGITALRDVLSRQAERSPPGSVKYLPHEVDILNFCRNYPDLKCIFFIRDPLSRFVSGFYSRQRQGRPRYNSPWKPEEAEAFKNFSSPNILAESLKSEDKKRAKAAYDAMLSISHIKNNYQSWLHSVECLETHNDRIAYIGQQETLNEDLERLRPLLGIDEDLLLPSDNIQAHRNPRGLDYQLSKLAIENLTEWYEEDKKLYQWCRDWRHTHLK